MEDEKKQEEAVTFDDVISKLGDFGRYQKRVFFLMCLLPMTVSIQTLMTVFTMATPDHRCAIPELPNDTFSPWGIEHRELLNLSVPWELDDDDKPMRSQCKLYRNRNQSETLLSNRSTVSCDKWVYDHSTFESTFTEEADLVCDRKEYHANADMIYMVGVLVGSLLIGLYSDRFGRKTALLTALVVHVGCAIGTSFVRSYAAFVALRFFIGMSNLGVFLVAYVLGLELVGSSYRTVAGSVIQMFWPVGLFLQTGVAYGLRQWNYLQLALSCPPVLFFSYILLVKESPRWLASRGRTEEANAMLEQVAKVNGEAASPKLQSHDDSQTEVKKESTLRMFTNRTTLIRTLIIFINWVVVTMVYYGLSLNVGSLGGSLYLNSFLSSVAELLGYLVALVGLDRLGR